MKTFIQTTSWVRFSFDWSWHFKNLKVHDNATTIYLEVIVPGRVANGEAFEYDICYIKTVGKNHLGRPRFIDTIKLESKNENLKAEGILGNFKVVGTTYIVTKESYVKSLWYEISEKIKEFEVKGAISGSTSILPARQGIVVRILGNSTEDVKKIIFEVVNIARKQIVGASFSSIRKAWSIEE